MIQTGVALIDGILKEAVADSDILLACTYAGCGSADSWPKALIQ